MTDLGCVLVRNSETGEECWMVRILYFANPEPNTYIVDAICDREPVRVENPPSWKRLSPPIDMKSKAEKIREAEEFIRNWDKKHPNPRRYSPHRYSMGFSVNEDVLYEDLYEDERIIERLNEEYKKRWGKFRS